MKDVDENEFNEYVRKVNAIPDGFRANGAFMQTRWMVDGVEVARSNADRRGIIYEIAESEYERK